MTTPRRRLKAVKTCPECLTDFRPSYRAQVCCCSVCGAIRRQRQSPAASRGMLAANAARRQAYAKRLGATLRGMTPGEIWRLAYTRGYQAAWNRGRRAQEQERYA